MRGQRLYYVRTPIRGVNAKEDGIVTIPEGVVLNVVTDPGDERVITARLG